MLQLHLAAAVCCSHMWLLQYAVVSGQCMLLYTIVLVCLTCLLSSTAIKHPTDACFAPVVMLTAAKDADTRRRAVSEASPTSGVTTSGQSGGGRRSLFARRTSQTQATLEDTAASSAPPCIHVPANEWEVGSDVSRYSAGPGTAAASGHYASSSYGSPQEAGGNWLTGGNGENLSRTSGGASTTAGGVSRLRPMSADDATLTRYGALIKHRKVKSGISAPTTPRTSGERGMHVHVHSGYFSEAML